ncbi:MAG: PAS domain S-box protein [Oligoflexia bacterium]|nr:PAS domain S-box protein [Oligoflexia bacterium]
MNIEFYKNLVMEASNGYAFHKVILDNQERPIDYEFIEVNQVFEELTGIKSKDILGRKVTEVIPGIENDKFDWISFYGYIALNNGSDSFEQYSERLKKWYQVKVFSPKRGFFVTIFYETTKEKEKKRLIKNTRNWLLISLIPIIAFGFLVASFYIKDANENLRKDFLSQTLMVSKIIDLEKIQSLSGTEKDVSHPNYLHLKDQFRSIRDVGKNIRFIYILGRKASGEIFFYVDNEPPNSPDLSPPGQIYSEAAEGFHKVFNGEQSQVIGPVEDRWGTWVSGVVPIKYPNTEKIVAVMGMDIDANNWKRILLRETILPISTIFILLLSTAVALLTVRSFIKKNEFELELRKKHSRLRAVTKHGHIVIWEIDTQGIYTYINDVAEEIFGYKVSEIEGIMRWSQIRLGDNQHFFTVFDQTKPFENFENQIKTKDGRILTISTSAIPLFDDSGKFYGYQGFDRDITESRHAEQALLASEERYRVLFESSRDAVMTVGPPHWKFTSANPATVEMFKTNDEATFISFAPWEFSPEKQMDGQSSIILARKMIDEAMIIGSNFFEWMHKRMNGEVFPATVMLSRMEISGEFMLQATVRDITAEKLAESSLKRSEKRYRELFENSRDGVVVVNVQWEFIDANPAYCCMVGYTIDELRQKKLYSDFHSDWCTLHQKEIFQKQLLTNGHSDVFQTECIHKKGISFPIEIQSFAIFDEKDIMQHAWVIVRNITERRKAEDDTRNFQAQIIHSDKLASIGTLAAGVAHEINNPLSIINMYTDTLIASAGDTNSDVISTSDITNAADRIKQAVKRISNITSGLLHYARQDADQLEPIDIHNAIIDAYELVVNLFTKDNVETKLELTATKTIVVGNLGKIQQVVMNMLVNARDAIKEKNGEGIIKISSENVGDCICIEIADNGIGMDKKIKGQIFDAFFTTKGPGKGTGMGLSISQSIIALLGGKITCESEKKSGSTFTIELPLHYDDGTHSSSILTGSLQTAKDVDEKSQGQKETSPIIKKVLIVDDEEIIRRFLCMYIKKIGLAVEEAADGEAALLILKERTFDYVLTDMQMPKMRGDVLIREARKISHLKDTKFFIITGGIYAEQLTEQENSGCEGIYGYIRKPFDLAEIKKLLIDHNA